MKESVGAFETDNLVVFILSLSIVDFNSLEDESFNNLKLLQISFSLGRFLFICTDQFSQPSRHRL